MKKSSRPARPSAPGATHALVYLGPGPESDQVGLDLIAVERIPNERADDDVDTRWLEWVPVEAENWNLEAADGVIESKGYRRVSEWTMLPSSDLVDAEAEIEPLGSDPAEPAADAQ